MAPPSRKLGTSPWTRSVSAEVLVHPTHAETHQISAISGMSTSIQYSYGRTLKEQYEVAIATLLDTVQRNVNAYNGFHSGAPIEPTKFGLFRM